MAPLSLAADRQAADPDQETHAKIVPVDAQFAGRAHRAMRKFQIAFLRKDGTPDWTEQIGPAAPFFEAAFSAFCHGTLITTPRGQIAVQDLDPGMSVSTETRGPMKVLWIGSMTLVPQALGVDQVACRLTRIMPDAFGLGKPEANLLVGPGARILTRPRGHDLGLGRERMLVPARDLADGVNVVEIAPPRPVTVYHIALRRHAVIRAAGIETESFHPGMGFERHLGPNLLTLFLSLFPHIETPADFGTTAVPRLDLPII
ncbi:Hint domain-containing protein [Roseovarius aestuariivivens]|uniref:Hint domain-containing protein n=1 Tax=Roseovarius aestuariivivens TaxID=1888910 RepID=UPI0010815349|nr:Hint domain-containing protein [Roseovarius aestuariivivens]